MRRRMLSRRNRPAASGRWVLSAMLVAAWVSALPLPARAVEILVFAAASLTDALRDIGRDFETETGNTVIYNFAGSNVLALQLQSGARADVFFSADEPIMDGLEKKGLLRDGTRRSLLSNTLVVAVAADSRLQIRSLDDLRQPGMGRIALAEPTSVPAGKYAKQYLKSKGLWNALLDKLVPTENVRAALAAVEAGNVDAAFVYKTDAGISRKVRIALEVERSEGPPISYPVAGLRDSKQPEAGGRFLEYLRGAAATGVFERYGFVVLPGTR